MNEYRAHVTYRVPYADTDQMGVVYYGNYLTYFERARNELLRDLDFPYTEVERRGYAMPVTEAQVRYKAAAGYDDQLDIYGWVGWIKGARLRVDCAIYCRGKLLAEGHTVHAFVRRDSLRPVRVIPELVERCSSMPTTSPEPQTKG